MLSNHFSCRLVPKPDCWFRCFEGMNKEIYVAMQGASEFTFGGVLKGWNVTDDIKRHVKCPTLVIRGEYDTMTERCHQLIVDSIPAAHPLVTIPRAGHCKLIDEPQLCCDAIERFVACNEAAAEAAAAAVARESAARREAEAVLPPAPPKRRK